MTENNPELPDYASPPLIEVACGVRFSPINSLKIPHYGLFWKDVYDDFPTSQHASPLGDLSERIEPSGFPLPRVI